MFPHFQSDQFPKFILLALSLSLLVTTIKPYPLARSLISLLSCVDWLLFAYNDSLLKIRAISRTSVTTKLYTCSLVRFHLLCLLLCVDWLPRNLQSLHPSHHKTIYLLARPLSSSLLVVMCWLIAAWTYNHSALLSSQSNFPHAYHHKTLYTCSLICSIFRSSPVCCRVCWLILPINHLLLR
jgi:hypothetical protein